MLVFNGFGIGCFGLRNFGILSSVTIALISGVMSLFFLFAFFSWMKVTTYFIITLVTLAILTSALICCLNRRKWFTINFGLLGFLAGFLIWNLFYAVLY